MWDWCQTSYLTLSNSGLFFQPSIFSPEAHSPFHWISSMSMCLVCFSTTTLSFTPPWRSRRTLRGTFSTRPTKQTVSITLCILPNAHAHTHLHCHLFLILLSHSPTLVRDTSPKQFLHYPCFHCGAKPRWYNVGVRLEILSKLCFLLTFKPMKHRSKLSADFRGPAEVSFSGQKSFKSEQFHPADTWVSAPGLLITNPVYSSFCSKLLLHSSFSSLSSPLTCYIPLTFPPTSSSLYPALPFLNVYYCSLCSSTLPLSSFYFFILFLFSPPPAYLNDQKKPAIHASLYFYWLLLY